MKVSIRHHYHYSNVIINQETLVQGKALTGTSIPALLRSGDCWYRPFGGVLDDNAVTEDTQRIKLVNITALWWNDAGMGQGYEIPIDHAVKGYLLNDRYYVAIKEAKPIHWPVERLRSTYRTDNVVELKQAK